MAQWNGLDVSVEAHRIALQIQGNCGLALLPDDYNIAAIKTDLRRFYVATGGKRGPDGYEPSTREYRRLYNGKVSGAALLATAKGEFAPPPSESKATETVPATGEEAGLLALKKLLGADERQVADLARKAVDSRVGEVLSSMHGLIADEVSRQVRTLVIKVAERPEVKLDTVHKAFEDALAYAAQRVAFMMVGPAGSGKTTIAEQIAEALGLPFFMSGKCADEIKITGYMDAGGTYRTTAFRQAYEFGGVFLFDEMDGWSPDALIAVNAPLAGKWGDFPDGMIKKHPDFVPIAAANTFGRGADRQYVGREQLDAASLDRFAVVVVDYDEDLELSLGADRKWTEYVIKVRHAVDREKVRHVVSPRASIMGGIMLKAGRSKSQIEEELIWKGLEEPVRNRVKAALR